MYLRYKIFFVLLLSSFSLSFAQLDEEEGFQLNLPDGLGFSNQLEYSNDINKKLEVFENWLNVDYRSGIFSAGIRFDVFEPNDPSPAINRGKKRFTEIDYKYIKAEIGESDEGAEITVGNYYALFGRGLVLRSYEDRNIRIDNNLLGVKLTGRYSGFILTALTGMPETSSRERKDILHAVDLEYRGLRELKIGGSFASSQPNEDGAARTSLAALRIQPSIWNFDMYAEYGIKQNENIKSQVFKGEEKLIGRALYGSANFYYEFFSLLGEYKYYDNFTFGSADMTVGYNQPPAVRREYTYLLLNRHPFPLNPDNEKGFQVETNFNISDETYFLASYGETKSLAEDSYFQRVFGSKLPVVTQQKEAYVQGSQKWGDFLSTVAAFGYNEEISANTISITPILENRLYLDDLNTLKLVVEHQQTRDRTTTEQYYTDVVMLEWLRSPKLSIAFVTEMQTREPEEGRLVRRFWNLIQFGYLIGEHTNLTLLVGSRQAGNVCIGGVCRYEPEFSGVEVKMLTRF